MRVGVSGRGIGGLGDLANKGVSKEASDNNGGICSREINI